ncbi:PDR/VanB family oxidoreductase [Achromobacter sp. UMC71]|uniref:PDR/VanB family oxidoreductase n=1 Tax=Achromobacter sp. UMC71 TaxID=1862320 RepID=UPI001603DDD1|nr:PDR/VanB family oxidoreductase [Achromobacter sp. UMC71]MBB1626837.1 ferredoxin--NADP(+) reductase [Achromobacter sp. UMC71]
MTKSHEKIDVRVTGVEQASARVKRFTLERMDGTPLPPFSGGSHVIVQMCDARGNRYSNAYSLMSDPADTRRYQIGVRLEEQSRGGSAFMHEQVRPGSELVITAPNNLFALHDSPGRHIMVAGGIGITPFLAQLPELHRRAASYELHYAYRAPEHAAFRDDLLASPYAAHVRFHVDSQGEKLDLVRLAQDLREPDHLYVCGPKPLIDAVICEANAAGVAPGRVHWEQFAATPAAGGAFTVVLARSGTELRVEAGASILQAIEKSNAADVECLCREGVCGTCETRILAGQAEHFDQYLSDEEKAAQQTMMICVSRARGDRLVLDL